MYVPYIYIYLYCHTYECIYITTVIHFSLSRSLHLSLSTYIYMYMLPCICYYLCKYLYSTDYIIFPTLLKHVSPRTAIPPQAVLRAARPLLCRRPPPQAHLQAARPLRCKRHPPHAGPLQAGDVYSINIVHVCRNTYELVCIFKHTLQTPYCLLPICLPSCEG